MAANTGKTANPTGTMAHTSSFASCPLGIRVNEEGDSSPAIDMTQRESGPDQRRWSRHKIDIRLKVSCQQDGHAITAFGRANTLSQGGMGAYIPCSLAIGTRILLELTFPYSSAEVKINAVVRSCEGFRYGLEFIDLRDELRKMIVNNCNSSPLC